MSSHTDSNLQLLKSLWSNDKSNNKVTSFVTEQTQARSQAAAQGAFLKVLSEVSAEKCRQQGYKQTVQEGNNIMSVKSKTDDVQNVSLELRLLREKLAILFEYEKNYLNLIKDFKEEIKFIHALQEDLRKERAKFFSETLREVSATLTQAQVEETVASGWIMDLVKSYTGSLDLSGSLVDENALNTIGKIRAAAKNQVAELSLNTQNEPS